MIKKNILLLFPIIACCNAQAKTKYETVEFQLPGGTFMLNLKSGQVQTDQNTESKSVTVEHDESIVTYTGREASEEEEFELTKIDSKIMEYEPIVGYDYVVDTSNGNYDTTRIREFIHRHEGKRFKVYLDTRYFPTVCIGNNLHNTPQWVHELDWKDDTTGRMLNSSQKDELYRAVMAYAQSAKNSNDPMVSKVSTNTITDPGVRLSDGTQVANISTSDTACMRLLDIRINNAIDDLRKKFKDFESFPNIVKDSLVDMRFAMGAGAFSRERTNLEDMPAFFDMIDRRDWAGAGTHLQIWRKIRQDRKDWLTENFMRAAKAEPTYNPQLAMNN